MNKRIWIELPKEKWKRNIQERRRRRKTARLTTLRISDLKLLDLMLEQWLQMK